MKTCSGISPERREMSVEQAELKDRGACEEQK